ncbi:MAG: tetratricopeptide repeat protein [Candidatus Omnitrophota bacterium]
MVIQKNNLITLRHLLLIGILGFFVYLNSLNGDFIWDDDVYIRYNAHIRDSSCIFRAFSEKMADGYIGVTSSGNFYRPLQKILYTIGYAFWGLQPLGYHLLSLILHIGVALCLYWLITIIFTDQIFAWIVALLYVVHPVHVEAVANMSGTQDPLSSVFLLLAFVFYLKTDRSFRASSLIFTLFCFFGALLSKENSIVFPLILLLYHYAYKKKIKPVLFILVLGLIFLYFLVRVTALGSFPLEPGKSGLMFARIPSFFVAFINYIRILFFPIDLRVHYGDMLFRYSDVKVLLGMLLFVVTLWYAIKNRQRDKLFFFSAGWFFIFLLPLTNIYPINDSFMKEHWLYLPSIGFFLILSRSLLKFCNNEKLKVFGLMSFIIIMVSCSVCTIKLNAYWRDPFAFFKRSLTYLPDYAVFYNELGIEYEKLGLSQEASGFYQRALSKNPRYIDPYFNLGRAFVREGKYAEAIPLFQQLLLNNPENLSLYYSVAYCYGKIGRKDEAAKLCDQALQKTAEYAQKYRALGDKYKEINQGKDAIIAYKKALSFVPEDVSLNNDLGCAYILDGDFEQAIRLFQEVLRTDPSNATIHNNLALAFYYSKKYDLAVSHFDTAAKLGYQVDPTILSHLRSCRSDNLRGRDI